MSIRKTFGVALAGTLAASGLLLGAAPSNAVVVDGPWDSDFTPADGDLIGVGSDTTQEVVFGLAEAWNNQAVAPAYKIMTFGAAVQNGAPLNGCDDLTNHPENCQITLPVSGTVNRPNGSGAGKARLYGAGNVADVDFARSSSSLNTNETNASLQQIPFALDTLGMAVSNNVASHAPASLTISQIVQIYKGEVTNWNQVGGTNGVIEPLAPQTSSGTYSFFDAQLKAANGGTPIVYAASVQFVQEHDDTPIKNNANAIAPFSIGRAGLLGTTLKIEGGWTAQRALYNVVRGSQLADPKIQGVFGPNGFICSDQVTNLINDYGFEQLAREADGGVCGVATQTATSDFTVNAPPAPVATTTTVTGTSSGAGKARLTATVAASPTAEGTVTFLEGDAELAADVPLIGGTATANLSGLTPGDHAVHAVFTPDPATGFVTSEDDGSVLVKAASTISETFPTRTKAGKAGKGTVTVDLVGTDTDPTGKVVVKNKAKTLVSGRLVGGKVTLTLPKLPQGRYSLTIAWAGDAAGVPATKKFTITQR